MTSKNYRRGYDAERDLITRLQERGYWAEFRVVSGGGEIVEGKIL